MAKFEVAGQTVELSEDEVQDIISNQTGIVLYKDKLNLIRDFTTEQKALFIDALISDRLDNEPQELTDPLVKMIYKLIQQSFDYTDEQYIKKTLRNRINGGKSKIKSFDSIANGTH